MDADAALLRLRLAGFAAADRLASDAALGELADQGWARYTDGRAAGVPSGWSLTPAGRVEADRRLAVDVDRHGCRSAVEDGYRRFLAFNRPLLEVITDWQVRQGVVNDHADRAYDGQVLARLERINEMISSVLVDLANCVDRYGSYQARLDTAIEQVRGGEPSYVDRPLIDSYHTVWFELHEDLLATLGLDRSQEHPEHGEPGPTPTSEEP